MKLFVVAMSWNVDRYENTTEIPYDRLTFWHEVPKDPDYVVIGEANFEPAYYPQEKVVAGRVEALTNQREELTTRYYKTRQEIQEKLESLTALTYQPQEEVYDSN